MIMVGLGHLLGKQFVLMLGQSAQVRPMPTSKHRFAVLVPALTGKLTVDWQRFEAGLLQLVDLVADFVLR